MKWHKKILRVNRREILISAVLSIVFALVLSIWTFALGKTFEVRNYEPISEPSFFVRLLYSALVYVTLGRGLYVIGFYQALHAVFVGVLNDWKLYKAIKDILWLFLMGIMFFWIVPFVVWIMNAAISFVLNTLNFILYVLPPLGITLILYILYFMMRKVLEMHQIRG